MKLTNALTAMSLILLVSQTVQQPAFADKPYDPSDGYESGGNGSGPNGPGPNDTGTGNPGTSNNPGNSHEGRGGYGSDTPGAPNAGGSPYGGYGTQTPGAPNAGGSPYASTLPGRPFNVQLGYQSLVLMDACTLVVSSVENSCLLKAN